ncbi:MAG: ABC transporter permease [Actinomycetales bacterium]|nr:MAG: ABC transporter permease [Actinomycetales bacterium]
MRNSLSKFGQAIKLPGLSFGLAFTLTGFIIAFSDSKVLSKIGSPLEFIKSAGATAGNAYLALFQGSIFDINLTKSHNFFQGFYPLSETIVIATPLILTGLSVALAFKSGLFNIGAQGQFIFGAIGASYVGFHFHLPLVIHVIAAALAGMALASIWGGAVGLLKAKTGAHEVILTIMMNYIAGYFILWTLKTSQFLRPGRIDPIAPEVNQSARLPLLAGANLRIHAGIFIALAAALFVWWLLTKTTIGYKFRAVGANGQAAKTAGISVPFVLTATMAICGALAGLGGAVQVLGSEHALNADIAGSFGFDAITVALLGRAQPLGTVFAALLFGALHAGGRTMQSNTGVPLDIVLVTQALIVLFIAAPTFVRFIFRLKKLNSSAGLTSKGWNG